MGFFSSRGMRCPCHQPDAPSSGFDGAFLGIDEGAGRFGTVEILACRKCGSRWVRYSMELEGITASGRWFRCPIDAGDVKAMTPEKALDRLRVAEWYFYGGSYYRSAGSLGKGSVPLP